MDFLKGHGTENDFVLVPDLDSELELTPALVAALCDRRAGIGGDGVLRVVRAAESGADWFMDYRNADGSLAEMCGNGIRVYARYLLEAGLAKPDALVAIATRGGVREVRFDEDGDVTVDMGPAELPEQLRHLRVTVGPDREWDAVGVLVPNPHAVAFVADLGAAGDLRTAPSVTPQGSFPDGVNVEFVVDRGPRQVAMRVHERGSGETRSCGTGACAVAVAAMRRDGVRGATYVVDVPGGRLRVTERADGHVELTGPAVLVAGGTVEESWLRGLG